MIFGFGEKGHTNLLTRALADVGQHCDTVPDPAQLEYHLPGGLNVAVDRDYERFIADLSARFPHEAKGIRAFYVSADNEVGRSATSSLAGGVSAGDPGADAQGPGDAGTTDQSPTQPVHDETTRWQQPGGCCRSGWHLSAQRPPD